MGRVEERIKVLSLSCLLLREHTLVVVVVDILFFKATETPRLQVVLSVGNLLLTMLAGWLFVDHHPDGIIVIIRQSSGLLSNGERGVACALVLSPGKSGES